MEKKMYWVIENNDDMNMVVEDLETIAYIIESETETKDEDEMEDVEFIIKPVFYTEEEFLKLEESE